MIQISLFLFFIFGTAVGSFLNVIAYRSVHGDPKRPDLKKFPRSGLRSILFGSSVCPKCKHKLGPVDLIPIVSFLLLKGRCRYCHKKISPQYPLVEVATGILFAFTFFHWYYSISLINSINSINSINFILLINLIYLLFIVSTLVVLFITDFRDSLLPNSIVLPAIVVVAAYKLLQGISGSLGNIREYQGAASSSLIFPHFPSYSLIFLDFLAAFLVASGFFAIVYLSRERALGGGDIKFVFLISLAVGWPSLLVALWLAFLTGGAVAAMLLLTRKKRFGQTVPLGPFLAIGAIVALFWGQQIIGWYLSVLGT